MYGFIHRLALQSRKGTIMRIWIFTFIFLLLLQACVEEEMAHPTSNVLPDSSVSMSPALQQIATGDTDRMHQVADDQSAGRNPPRTFSYTDPATGTQYLINSGWRIVPRQRKTGPSGQPLAKAAGSLIQTWTDWSGQVETRIYECVSPNEAQHQTLGCQVEPGFVLTGGGAYADYGSGPGALLWESRPLDESLVTWLASSKDHISPSPHILHVYAIGIRLKDNGGTYIPATTLLGTIKMKSVTSSMAEHTPNIWQTGPIFLGGGARTNWSCCGSLLTDLNLTLRQESEFLSMGKDHGREELSTITNYGIYAKATYPCCQQKVAIPYFGDLKFAWKENQGSTVSTGVAVAYRDADVGWVITGPGARSQWVSGPGRLLFGVKPTGTFQGQVGVYTKDHKTVSAGFATAYIAEVQKCCM
jgi:hypothetical protein